MSIQEIGADVCEICDGYSNAGFDLCEECAMKFALWFFIQHNKGFKNLMDEELILDDNDGLWGYSKVSDFMNKAYEEFKKVNKRKFNWYEDMLKLKEGKKL